MSIAASRVGDHLFNSLQVSRRNPKSQAALCATQVTEIILLARKEPLDFGDRLTDDTTGDTIIVMESLKCPCRVVIPLVYNDGKGVEPEVIAEILGSFNRQFGGYTPLGSTEGSWFGQVERSMRVEVAVLEGRIPELREVVYAIGKRLGQKEMYFDAPRPSVEFLKIEDGFLGAASEAGGS